LKDDDAMSATVTVEPHPRELVETRPDVVHAFIASPEFALDRVCLSARESGIWRSDDGGASFRQVFGAASAGGTATATCFAFAPGYERNQTVWAGAAGMVLRSGDGGRQWRAIPLPPPAPLVTSLALSPAYDDDGVILAGTLEDGVLRSDDRGDTWKRWNFGLLDLSVYSLAISPTFAVNETIFAGAETALFKSENGGRSWRETAFPEAAPPVVALTLDRHGALWAGTEQHGLWTSPDDGATWRRVDDGIVTGAVNQIHLDGDACLAVLPDSMMLSGGPGQHWQPMGSDLSEGGGIAGAVAPWGLDDSASLLVQQRHGRVRQLRIGRE
jgi:photosystem II stability/assembly factor-like uncharacterized protein